VREQPLQHRDDEGGRLAGAGFRAGNQVAAAECQRNDRGLNRPGVDPTEVADAFQQTRVEAERLERQRRGVDLNRLERRNADEGFGACG
jgi:hypothetical protein